MEAMLIIDSYGLAILIYRFRERVKPFLAAEAIICLSFIYELFCILKIYALCLPLRLHIGATATVLIGALIIFQPRGFQSPVYYIYGTLNISFLIRILYP